MKKSILARFLALFIALSAIAVAGGFANFSGTWSNNWQIGGATGPQIVANAGAIDAKDSSGASLVNVRVAAAVGTTDAVQKAALDTEATTRSSADTTLTSAIAAEASTRAADDLTTLADAENYSDTNFVPLSRTLTATTPIKIDGLSSASLAASRDISILAASGSNAGSMSSAHYSKLDALPSTIAAGSGLTTATVGSTQTLSADFGTGGGKVTQGNDSRLPPTPSSAGKIVYDSGASAYTSAVAAGDVTGAPTAFVVGKIQGRTVASTAPATGQVLAYDGSQWAPAYTPWQTVKDFDFTDGTNNQTFVDASGFQSVTVGGVTCKTRTSNSGGAYQAGSINGAVSASTYGINSSGLNVASAAGNVQDRFISFSCQLSNLGIYLQEWDATRITLQWSIDATPSSTSQVGMALGWSLAGDPLTNPRVAGGMFWNASGGRVNLNNLLGTTTNLGTEQGASPTTMSVTMTSTGTASGQFGSGSGTTFPAESAMTFFEMVPSVGQLNTGGAGVAGTATIVYFRVYNTTTQTPTWHVKRMRVQVRRRRPVKLRRRQRRIFISPANDNAHREVVAA
jgi:hypothetical protein